MMQRMVIRLRSENLDDIHSDLGVKISWIYNVDY